MNKNHVLSVALAATAVGAGWAGCSSKSGGSTATSTTGTSSATGAGGSGGSGGAGGAGTGGTGTASSGAGGGAGVGVFSCNPAPATPPSGGSCVTVAPMNDAGTGIGCNPVTNAVCAAGDECDIARDTSGNIVAWVCYPGPNTALLCQDCDDSNGPTCGGGQTCFTASSTAKACAQYCCTDADCGATGTCTTSQSGTTFFGPLAPDLGVCLKM